MSLASGTYYATGSAATSASKAATCNAISSTDVRCIVAGINTNSLGNGAVATVSFKIAANTTNTSTQVSISNQALSNASASALAVNASGGTVTINQSAPTATVSSLTCSPASVTPPATSSCTVTLNTSVSSSTAVTLGSNAAQASVPASVNVSAGQSSANFTVTTSAVSSTTNATITATLGSSKSFLVTLTPASAPTALGFVPLTPCRIADTRVGFGFTGSFGPPSLVGGASRTFPVMSSGCNVPSSAQAYSLNITVVPQGPLSYLTVWPAGLSLPNQSTMNAPTGAVTANAAIVAAGTSGAIKVFASNTADVLIDINGYFAAASLPQTLDFYPVAPCRVADTRSGFGFSGAFGPPSLAANGTRNFPVEQSDCAIPSSAEAYSVRMTAVPTGPLVYLTTWPAGQTEPVVSTLNAPVGGAVGNQAIIPAGTATGGPLSVFASDPTDLIIDVNGYFAPPGSAGALHYYPLTPCRVADTRTGFGFSGAFGPPSLVGGGMRNFPLLTSSCSIPSTAQAYSLNLTAVVPASGSLVYLTAFATGTTMPLASTLNAPLGGVVASSAIVPAGTSGGVEVFSSDNTDLLIDIAGYFAP